VLQLEKFLQDKLAYARKDGESNVKDSDDKIRLAAKTEKEKLEQYAARVYGKLTNNKMGSVEKYMQKFTNYEMKAKANADAAMTSLAEMETKEKEVEQQMLSSEKQIFGLATTKKDLIEQQIDAEKAEGKVRGKAQNSGQKALKDLSKEQEAWNRKVNNLFDVGKYTLQDTMQTLLEMINMRSSGIIKEVESFTDSGMEQTNDAKRSMIEIGGKMEEAEQWIRDMLAEMRQLVVRGNSTGTTAIWALIF